MSAAQAPKPVRGSRPFGHLWINELRSVIRQPRGLILGFGAPLLLLIVFGSVQKFHTPLPSLGGATRFDLYVPILFIFSIAGIGLFSLPSYLASYREHGVLRRLSTTPVPPSWLLAAQLGVNLCIAAVTLALLYVLSTGVFGFQAPRGIDAVGGLLLTLVLTLGATLAIGIVIASVAPTGPAAYTIGALTFFPLMFFAGLWLPLATMPTILADIANYTPLGASVQAVQASLAGTFPPVWELLVLAGYTVVFGVLAPMVFRWE